MVIAVNPIKGVREPTDARDIGFMPGIHVGGKRSGQSCAPKNMHEMGQRQAQLERAPFILDAISSAPCPTHQLAQFAVPHDQAGHRSAQQPLVERKRHRAEGEV